MEKEKYRQKKREKTGIKSEKVKREICIHLFNVINVLNDGVVSYNVEVRKNC